MHVIHLHAYSGEVEQEQQFNVNYKL